MTQEHDVLAQLAELPPGLPLLLTEEDYNNSKLIKAETKRIADAARDREENFSAEEAAPPGKPPWAGKHPADMSLDELSDMRDWLAARQGLYQSKVQAISDAILNIDVRVASQFGQSFGDVQIPSWPRNALQEETGW